jgi:hypothetical protein
MKPYHDIVHSTHPNVNANHVLALLVDEQGSLSMLERSTFAQYADIIERGESGYTATELNAMAKNYGVRL